MRVSSLLIGALSLGLVLSLPLGLESARAGAKTDRADTLGVEQIKPGMKGYGLTVFEGVTPERFDVEVIDVLKNFQPRQDLILIKTKHPRLDVAKVVAGMSGSPIFLKDKMVGAYAYGWTFAAEPVAGVTPIANMIEDLEAPLPKGIHGWALSTLPKRPKVVRPEQTSARFRGDPADYDLKEHGAELASRRAVKTTSGSVLAPVATPLLLGGMTPESSRLIEDMLSPLGLTPVQAGGGAGKPDKDAPQHFVNGGAIGVNLIRGDLSAMGLGTVTRVEGDRLVAFGHPMMQAGVTALPTSIGRVLWFLASEMRSFKIGMPVRDLGTLVNDRQASIVVSESVHAPTIRARLSVKGLPSGSPSLWNVEIAHEKFMAPTFLASALGNALQSVLSERQDVSWVAKGRLKIKNYGTLEVEDFGVSVGGTPDSSDFAQSNLVDALGSILNNPWETAFVESVDVDIDVRYTRDIYRLRGAELLEPEIDAGDAARIRLVLVPFAGPEISHVITVPLPAHLAGSRVTLTVAPGYTEARDKPDVENLADLVSNLGKGTYPPRSLVISYEGGGGVTYRGHVANDLPPGAIDVLQARTSTVTPQVLRSKLRHVAPLKKYVIGTDQVTVKVRSILR